MKSDSHWLFNYKFICETYPNVVYSQSVSNNFRNWIFFDENKSLIHSKLYFQPIYRCKSTKPKADLSYNTIFYSIISKNRELYLAQPVVPKMCS